MKGIFNFHVMLPFQKFCLLSKATIKYLENSKRYLDLFFFQPVCKEERKGIEEEEMCGTNNDKQQTVNRHSGRSGTSGINGSNGINGNNV